MTNSTTGQRDEVIAALQNWIKGLQQRQAEAAAAERKRRAALTAEQRAAEDRDRAEVRARAGRQKIFKRFLKMGAPVLGRESWTLAHFSWLLVAENPLERGGLLDLETDRAAEQRQKIAAVLQSCVGATLAPLNPTERASEQRFRISDLLDVAVSKQLGYAALLRALLTSKSRPSYFPTIEPGSALDRDALHGSSDAGSAAWRDVLAGICRDIEQAAANGHLPRFRPDALPWSPKTLYQLAAHRHRVAGLGELPVNQDTVRKHLNRAHGWKSKPGYQDPDAIRQLRNLFEF